MPDVSVNATEPTLHGERPEGGTDHDATLPVAPGAAPRALAVGDRLGRYVILGRIGAGGMGSCTTTSSCPSEPPASSWRTADFKGSRGYGRAGCPVLPPSPPICPLPWQNHGNDRRGQRPGRRRQGGCRRGQRRLAG